MLDVYSTVNIQSIMKSAHSVLSTRFHAVMEHNAITGDTIPVMLCNNEFDANVIRVMYSAERFLTSEEAGEIYTYTVVSGIPCLD